MKVLTLWEPWATLYAHGIKKIETRPGPTKYRDTYLIHAAKKWTKQQEKICIKEPFFSALQNINALVLLSGKYYSFNFNLGHIIGAVDIKLCAIIGEFFGDTNISMTDWNDETVIKEPELSFGDYTPGRYAWLGKNHRVLENPIPYKGQQGYYANFKGDESQLVFK